MELKLARLAGRIAASAALAGGLAASALAQGAQQTPLPKPRPPITAVAQPETTQSNFNGIHSVGHTNGVLNSPPFCERGFERLNLLAQNIAATFPYPTHRIQHRPLYRKPATLEIILRYHSNRWRESGDLNFPKIDEHEFFRPFSSIQSAFGKHISVQHMLCLHQSTRWATSDM